MSDARLEDGTYDAFVLWADERDHTTLAIDLTVTSGAHRGDVLTVLATHGATRDAFGSEDPIALVGLPCRLVVEHGAPRLHG